MTIVVGKLGSDLSMGTLIALLLDIVRWVRLFDRSERKIYNI